MAKTESVFKASCEYKILCKSTPADVRPFPPCRGVSWGAGEKIVESYALVPGHRAALVTALNGRAELTFTTLGPVRLHACLVSERVPAAQLDRCVAVAETDNQARDPSTSGNKNLYETHKHQRISMNFYAPQLYR